MSGRIESRVGKRAGVLSAVAVFVACGGAQPSPKATAASESTSTPSASTSTASTPPTKLETMSASSLALPSKAPPAIASASPPKPASPAPSVTATTTTASKSDASSKDAASKAPAPEAVCARVVKLMDAQLAAAGASMPADQKKSIAAECEVEAKKDRAADPAGYACDASCIMSAATFDAIEGCKAKCPK